MATPLDAELDAYLRELAESTTKGNIEWQRVNPTTFVWESHSPAAKLSLQRLATTMRVRDKSSSRVVLRPSESYVFQAFGGPEEQLLLSINSNEKTSLLAALTELYKVVSGGVTRKTLDFLQSLLPNDEGDDA